MQASHAEEVKGTFFQRFSLQFRIQHFVLFLSVLTLIATGVPLWCINRPEYVWWAESAMGELGYIEAVRWIHHMAALALTGLCVYHLVYTIYTREGRREFVAFLPRSKDFVDVTMNLLYFLGRRKEGPRFGRYGYIEKFDYWALYWGCPIVIISGLTLWFTEISAGLAPWFSYELAALVHTYQAILDALALLIWHFYNVHFSPSRFPGTLLWVHGKVSREEMMSEHPLEYEKLSQRTEDEHE